MVECRRAASVNARVSGGEGAGCHMKRHARLLAKLLRTASPDRWLLIRAWLLLGIARLAVKVVPFSRLARRLGVPRTESPVEIPPHQMDEARRTRWAVSTAARHTMWRSNCLSQAIAAKYLLHGSGIDSTLYLGASFEAGIRLEAHAWLRCGSIYVAGEAGRQRFAPLGIFGPLGRRGRSRESVDSRPGEAVSNSRR